MAASDRLKPGMAQAVAVLAAGGSYAEAADAAGKSPRTVRRWATSHDGFRAEIDRLRKAALEEARTRLAAATGLAADRLVALVTEPASVAVIPASVRLGAARAVLQYAAAYVTHADFEDRLIALEAAAEKRNR